LAAEVAVEAVVVVESAADEAAAEAVLHRSTQSQAALAQPATEGAHLPVYDQ